MEIYEHNLLPFAFLCKQILDRADRCIAVFHVVAVVIMRMTELPLLAFLDAVLVHERHENAVGIVTQPGGFFRA